MHCHLLIPALFPSEEITKGLGIKLALPNLRALLTRGKQGQKFQGNMEDWLFNQFSITKQKDWPIASLTLENDGTSAENSFWLRADPVHLRLERNQLILADSSVFSISIEEAQQLSDSVDEILRAEDLSLYPLFHHRWYVKSNNHPDLQTFSLSEVIGKNIDDYLPHGKDGMKWQRLFNEIQMALHTHPVNQQRESRSELPINSIWFWGSGVYPKNITSSFSNVYSDESISQGLAKASKISCNTLPIDATNWIESTPTVHNTLVVLDMLHAPLQYNDLENWQLRLLAMEKNWFQPLCRFLREKKLNRLTIYGGTQTSYQQIDITPADLWKLWRMKSELITYSD